MPRERLLRTLAILICLVATLHLGAIVFYLYWTFWWYDMFLHLLGGIFISLLAVWVSFFSGYLRPHLSFTTGTVLCIALGSTLAFGIGWETFERALGHTWSIEGYSLDTMSDLLLDLAGGLLGFLYVMRRYAPRS